VIELRADENEGRSRNADGSSTRGERRMRERSVERRDTLVDGMVEGYAGGCWGKEEGGRRSARLGKVALKVEEWDVSQRVYRLG
jgi:hypothetical protein